MHLFRVFLCCLCLPCLWLCGHPKVQLGIDVLIQEGSFRSFKGKKVALLTNQTGLNSSLQPTLEVLQQAATDFDLVAIFSPEHGLQGAVYAGVPVSGTNPTKIPHFTLYGKDRRPTEEMLKGIDLILYDIQEIGCRSYTFATTLYFTMEEAAKRNIAVWVLDRPNPINGIVVDGPMLQPEYRSFVGYINVPYCHGMTIGELARFFNEEYQVGCSLTVVPMKGWKREMTYQDTGLIWTPTSPQVPEPETPFFYPITGLLGELSLVNIGVGYTLPFKIVGAPWIQADKFTHVLNKQRLPGVFFLPFYFTPYFGPYENKMCQGTRIVITDPKTFQPVTTSCWIIGLLKSLYPSEVSKRIQHLSKNRGTMFCKASGNSTSLDLLLTERYPAIKMAAVDQKERERFLIKRQKYLLY